MLSLSASGHFPFQNKLNYPAFSFHLVFNFLSLRLCAPPWRTGSSPWCRETSASQKRKAERVVRLMSREEQLSLLFSWLFLLFVFSLHLSQCEGYIFLHCSPIALEKYDRAKNKGKRFTEPSRSQLIEAAGMTPRVLLLRASDMQRHLPIKHSVLTPEIKHLYSCSENAFYAFLSLTLCLNSSFLKYNFSLRT